MKNNLIIFLIAISFGFLFAFYIFKGVDKTFAQIKDNNTIYLYQIGVFKNQENANNESSKYPSGIVIKDDDLYRVYIGIALDNEVKQDYEAFFKKNDINFYTKKIQLSNNCIKKIKSYESIIKKSFNEDIYFHVNKILLNYYKDGCND